MTTSRSQARTMKRTMVLGFVLAVAGLGVAAGGFAYGVPTAQDGLASAQAMYEAQGVTLSYNDEGQLVDRGSTELAQAILALLEDEWQYPVNHANLDPNDPLVNTRDELMFQYATIAYHVLIREVPVTLSEADVPITYRGVTYAVPGEYRIAVGDYFANLDRSHPIEGQLRAAWDPMALSLLASLAGGHANEAAGELALMTSMGIGAVGLLFFVAGAGLVWVSMPVKAPVPVSSAPRAKERPVVQVRSVAKATPQARECQCAHTKTHAAERPRLVVTAQPGPRRIQPRP